MTDKLVITPKGVTFDPPCIRCVGRWGQEPILVTQDEFPKYLAAGYVEIVPFPEHQGRGPRTPLT